MSTVHFSREDVRVRLKDEYTKRIEKEQATIDLLKLDREAIAVEESQWVRRHLLLTEKDNAINSFRQGVLNREIYDKLLADIDERLLRLESGEEEKITVEEIKTLNV